MGRMETCLIRSWCQGWCSWAECFPAFSRSHDLCRRVQELFTCDRNFSGRPFQISSPNYIAEWHFRFGPTAVCLSFQWVADTTLPSTIAYMTKIRSTFVNVICSNASRKATFRDSILHDALPFRILQSLGPRASNMHLNVMALACVIAKIFVAPLHQFIMCKSRTLHGTLRTQLDLRN